MPPASHLSSRSGLSLTTASRQLHAAGSLLPPLPDASDARALAMLSLSRSSRSLLTYSLSLSLHSLLSHSPLLLGSGRGRGYVRAQRMVAPGGRSVDSGVYHPVHSGVSLYPVHSGVYHSTADRNTPGCQSRATQARGQWHCCRSIHTNKMESSAAGAYKSLLPEHTYKSDGGLCCRVVKSAASFHLLLVRISLCAEG